MTDQPPFRSLLACNCCQGEPLPIVYGRGRYPDSQKKGHCRGCGAPLPKGRYSWCCNACYERFEPASVLRAVRKRDNDICAHCGHDSKKARAEWTQQCRERRISTRSFAAKDLATWRRAEYDHIIPFSEGGLTILENMRTLCETCHKARTAEWHRLKPRKRKMRSL